MREKEKAVFSVKGIRNKGIAYRIVRDSKAVQKMRKQIQILMILLLGDALLLFLILAGIKKGISNGIVDGLKTGIVVSSDEEQDTGMQKFAAITFDDGPHREYTKRLLEGLKVRGVKATFFLTGVCIEGNEEVVAELQNDGHLIAVHCMQHTDLTEMPVEKAVEHLRYTGEQIMEITGKQPEYIRPPYGKWSEKLGEAVRQDLGMVPVFWDVDSRDWDLQHVGKIVKKVEADVENGDIILFHDEFETSVDAALQIIDNLMAKGYTFVTVNELMVD